ncbi:hypothetical protein H0H81_007992 [Sphagnurus paluster]|uniref:Uncharacterized protein n=1 Tax=Sphagnurus paluster TaxID=117069 RepID=A0A9P7K510_9AGAR|nr:hypothetical protein H0H81_007992 [Sphagnurus paluster]
MPTQRIETGTPTQLDCDVAINYNAGCGVRFTSDPLSFGPPFNTAGGGWFVMERTPQFFKVWFWTRDSTNVPFEVKFGSPDIDTSKWGTPAAYFPNTSTCDFATHFNPHNIIINLTLCGDWAGNTYAGTSCPLTCVEQVNTAPGSFIDAYFDFKSMRIYE